MLFSIGSLYVVKTFDRDGAGRGRHRHRETAVSDVRLRTVSDPTVR